MALKQCRLVDLTSPRWSSPAELGRSFVALADRQSKNILSHPVQEIPPEKERVFAEDNIVVVCSLMRVCITAAAGSIDRGSQRRQTSYQYRLICRSELINSAKTLQSFEFQKSDLRA